MAIGPRLLICTQAVDLDDPVLGFFHRWIAEFAKHCEHVHVICLKEGRHELPENVTVHSLGKPRKSPADSRGLDKAKARMFYVRNFYRHIIALRDEYDAVFVHMNPEYVVLGGWFWRLWNKKVGLWYVHKRVAPYLRIADMFANVVFTANTESIRLKSNKVVPVGHGIDTSIFKPRTEAGDASLRILTIGRISPSKRVMEMLQVLDVLHERGVPFTFAIAGGPITSADKSYEARMRAEISKSPYAAGVHILGPVSHGEVPDLLAKADVFLNLSETGGVDKAVLEALAASVPTVTTNETFREMLSQYGLFVEKYSPESVADALLRAHGTDMAELRATVEREHSLARLIPAILTKLGS
ncbi:MAG: glycosyltransferase family 4 protein [Patescibacteria group bacterium]|nr:glycosyltransferase family 4 protein [Patescibacteria group bacterium]